MRATKGRWSQLDLLVGETTKMLAFAIVGTRAERFYGMEFGIPVCKTQQGFCMCFTTPVTIT